MGNQGSNGREAAAIDKGYYGSNVQKNLVFVTGGNVIDSLYVAEVARTDLSLTVPGTVSYGSTDFTPNNASYADNHKAIVYYPEYCMNGSDEDTKGKIVVKYDADSQTYSWVVNNNQPNLAGATVVSGSSSFT